MNVHFDIPKTDPCVDTTLEMIGSSSLPEQELLGRVCEMRLRHSSNLESIEREYLAQKSQEILLDTTSKPVHQVVSFNSTVSLDQFPVHQIENRSSSSSKQNERGETVKRAWNFDEIREEEFKDYSIFDPSTVVYESEEEIDHQAWIDNISDSLTSVSEYEMYNRSNLDDSSVDNRKRDITIPIPFSFTDREYSKAKSIRRKRFEEYLRTLREEEEYYRKNTFKANPIPLSTIEPRFEQLQVRNSLNKKHLKTTARELARSLQNPFKFAERDAKKAKEKESRMKPKVEKFPQFKANPVPRSTKEVRYDKMLRMNEKIRQRRIEVRSRDLFHRSSLPPRMAMHEALKTTQGQTLKEVTRFSFQPKINATVPDFARLQNEFYSEMSMKKQSKPLTQVKEFSFHSSSSENRIRSQAKQMDEYDHNVQKDTYRSSTVPPLYKTPKVKAEPTKAQKLRDEMIRKTLEARERKRIEKEREDEEREAKRKNNTVLVAQNLGPTTTVDDELEIRRKAKMEDNTATKKVIAQRNLELKQKMQDRPLLFETDITRTARERVMNKIRKTLKETGTEYLLASLETVRGVNDTNMTHMSQSR